MSRVTGLMCWVARWSISFVLAGLLSYGLVFWLLGFRLLSDPYAEVAKVGDQIRQVVVFDTGGKCEACLRKFAQALGLQEPELLAATGQSQELLVTFDQIDALNPYPPVLKPPSYHPFWLSLGYLSDDDRYHQVTWYGGEADTTPSILVPKVPGRSGWGDYFVRYTVVVSREITRQPLILSSKTGEVTQWRPPDPRPDLESVTWDTYVGGSYDGLEEVEFTFFGTIVVGPILALLMRRRRFVGSGTKEGPPNTPLQRAIGPGVLAKESEDGAARR